MKIAVTVVIELDECQWADYNGLTSTREVREDVRSHILTVLQADTLLDEADADVKLRVGSR